MRRDAAWVHLWAKFWRCYEDFGGSRCVQFEKVRSHTTMADVQAGRISAVDRRGNAAADAAAREARLAGWANALARVLQ
jgi:hypothetical protein